jgi:hypothetical protein
MSFAKRLVIAVAMRVLCCVIMAGQVWLAGKRRIVGDVHKRQQRLRPRVYDDDVVKSLVKLWELLNYLCGKRLVAKPQVAWEFESR